MKIDLNFYQVVLIILVAGNIIATAFFALFIRWLKSEMKNGFNGMSSEMNLMKKDFENSNKITNQKIEHEKEIRIKECERHEKLSDVLFVKIDKLVDSFINAVTSIEKLKKQKG